MLASRWVTIAQPFRDQTNACLSGVDPVGEVRHPKRTHEPLAYLSHGVGLVGGEQKVGSPIAYSTEKVVRSHVGRAQKEGRPGPRDIGELAAPGARHADTEQGCDLGVYVLHPERD